MFLCKISAQYWLCFFTIFLCERRSPLPGLIVQVLPHLTDEFGPSHLGVSRWPDPPKRHTWLRILSLNTVKVTQFHKLPKLKHGRSVLSEAVKIYHPNCFTFLQSLLSGPHSFFLPTSRVPPVAKHCIFYCNCCSRCNNWSSRDSSVPVTHSSSPVGEVQFRLRWKKGQESNVLWWNKKRAVWPQPNELKVNTLNGRAAAGTGKGGGRRDSVEMGRHFPHIGTFLDVCTFALKKTICQTQPPTVFGFDSGGATLSFPHARPPLRGPCVHHCVWLAVFVCFVHNLIKVSLTENATHVFTKHGLCGNPLKETKISFQTEAKCWSPQIFMWWCHRWQPLRTATGLNWRLQSRFVKHFCFPQWEAPSTTLLVTLSICPGQELRGCSPESHVW